MKEKFFITKVTIVDEFGGMRSESILQDYNNPVLFENYVDAQSYISSLHRDTEYNKIMYQIQKVFVKR